MHMLFLISKFNEEKCKGNKILKLVELMCFLMRLCIFFCSTSLYYRLLFGNEGRWIANKFLIYTL